VTSGAVAAGDAPLKGEKPKGGTGRTHRFGGAAATDFRGDESPGGGRGSAAHARRGCETGSPRQRLLPWSYVLFRGYLG
jgi:hypothetical protein